MKTLLLLLYSTAISAQLGLLDLPSYPLSIDLKIEKPKQSFLEKYITKKRVITIGLCFSSGAFNGAGEILRNKYPKFKAVHPGANDQFWNPLLSWPNKWKNGDILQGERFFLSSTALVFLTDGYHLLRTFEKNLMVAAIVINFYERKKWYVYLAEFVAYSAAWSIGFHSTYTITYKGMRP